MRAFLIINGEHHDWVTKRLTPDESNHWEDLEMVDDINHADYVIVVNKPPLGGIETFKHFDKILYYKIEPDGFEYTKHYYDDTDEKSHYFPKDGQLIPATWKLDENWSQLESMGFPDNKTEDLLWITGTTGDQYTEDWVQTLEGHRLRMSFLDKFMKKYPDRLHLYGRGTERHGGDGFTNKRSELFFSHRYVFGFENSWQNGYATEKIYDAILAGCMPIYWGCPNLEEFLPEGSFIRLNIKEEDAVDKVIDIIESDYREQHLDALKQARELILHKYSLIPTFHRDIHSLQKEDYEMMYGGYNKIVFSTYGPGMFQESKGEWVNIDYKDKIVLDIGADYGSTAEFFLKKGAKQVIAVESDPKLGEQLKKFSENKNITPFISEINRSEKLVYLLQEFKPDIVKSDCEKCEKLFLGVPIEVLRIPKTYIVECHPDYVELADKRYLDMCSLLKMYFTQAEYQKKSHVYWSRTEDPLLFEKTKIEVFIYERLLDR